MSHIYQDLIRKDTPIYEIAEQNGFHNQKLFNRTFKSIYGCTPPRSEKGILTSTGRFYKISNRGLPILFFHMLG